METPRKVLLVTPHQDDAEGGCGGTVARWIREGAEVVYLLCTNGDKGSDDPEMTSERLAEVREREQLEAARVLGVKEVVFLRHPDGGLEDNREFRGQVIREIRRQRPDVVMCIDPFRTRSHSHRDHRVSGQVTVDAVCTYTWRHLYMPEHLAKDGLEPHMVKEIYLWATEEPDTYNDISDTVELKVQTLNEHVSQFSDLEGHAAHVRSRAKETGEQGNLPYAEAFRVLRFSVDSLMGE